jgi:hypothetical protein
LNVIPTKLTSSNPRRRTLYVLFFALLLLAAIGASGLRLARREHTILVRFRHHVERAAAPGELVLVDDKWLATLLHPSVTSDLQQKLVVTAKGLDPAAVLSSREEFVLVTRDDDPMLGSLRQHGFVLTQDAMWDESRLGEKLPIRGTVRIYFVAPSASR